MLDDGDKAIIKNIVRDETKDCPSCEVLAQSHFNLKKEVDEMQVNYREDLNMLFKENKEFRKEIGDRVFAILMAVLGSIATFIITLIFAVMKAASIMDKL